MTASTTFGRRLGRAAALSALVLLGGCVAVGTEGVNIARDRSIYNANIEAARAGDAVAQYRVGDALCCSIAASGPFYDTGDALDWLCRSARQEHGPAMLRVGRLLSGDVVDGIRLARRVATSVAGSPVDLPTAHAWLTAAEAAGVDGAGERAAAVLEQMSEEERSAADAPRETPLPEACTLEELGLA